MTSRDDILASIRANRPQVDRPHPSGGEIRQEEIVLSFPPAILRPERKIVLIDGRGARRHRDEKTGAASRQGVAHRSDKVGRAGYLIQCVEMSLRRMKLERIELYQLHRIDPRTPLEESLGALRRMGRRRRRLRRRWNGARALLPARLRSSGSTASGAGPRRRVGSAQARRGQNPDERAT